MLGNWRNYVISKIENYGRATNVHKENMEKLEKNIFTKIMFSFNILKIIWLLSLFPKLRNIDTRHYF